jgi:hypothetical protein
MTRAINNTPTVVAEAANAFPAMNTTMIQSNKVFRDIFDVRDVRIGAPNMTPKAYKDTVNPAVVTVMCKSLEMSGNNPTLMNSVVPIAKALIAKASNAHVLLFLFEIISSSPSCHFVLSLKLP